MAVNKTFWIGLVKDKNSLNFNFAHNSPPNHKPITNVTQRNSPEINCSHPCNMATYNCESNIESKIASVLLNKAVRLVRK